MKVLTHAEQIGFLDFPQLLKRYFANKISKEDLFNPDVKFHLSAPKEYFIRDDKLLPYEITHLNMRLPIAWGGVVSKEQCEAAALRSYYEFLQILLWKCGQDQVIFNSKGNHA